MPVNKRFSQEKIDTHQANNTPKPTTIPTRDQVIDRVIQAHVAEGRDPEEVREMIEAYGF